MIKLIYGPMRSGKSARLIEEIEKAKDKGLNIKCYKPKADTRSEYIKSRNGKLIECETVSSFISIYADVLELKEKPDMMFIDEVQFLNLTGLTRLVKFALENNIKIVASGLNLTSELCPFETTAKYSMFCTEIEIVHGTCEICNKEKSIFSKCNAKKDNEVLIGDEIYLQTCFKCFNI